MCNFWYSQALKTLGIDCPSTQKETDDFLSEVKNTLNTIIKSVRILTFTGMSSE